MKRLLICLFGTMLILSMNACGKTKTDEIINTQEITTMISEASTQPVDSNKEDQDTAESDSNDSGQNMWESAKEEESMKLFVNYVEIPVIWEGNASVAEIMEEASNGDIVVSMSMYGGNEQVGSFGKRYSSNDKQTTTHNGDIVLYNSSNLVVFYGSNSWAYTRLGKMDLSEKEVTDLLSNGDVTVTIKR